MFPLKETLLKLRHKLKRKAFVKKLERIIWIVEDRGCVDYDDITKSVREMISVTREDGVDTVLIKTIDDKFYYITGSKYGVIIPSDILKKTEVYMRSCRLEECVANYYTLTGAAILGIPADTIKKIVVIGVCDAGEFYKVYSLMEEKREELKKFLERIRNNESEQLEYLYDLKSIDYDDLLSRFFEITIHHDDIEGLVKYLFQIGKPKKFEEAIQYIRSHYNPRLLDELAGEIKEAIKNVIKAKSTK